MQLFIMVFWILMVIQCPIVRGDLDEKLGYCRDNTESLYLLESQVVEWSNSIQGRGWLNRCINESVVEQAFDSSLIVQYAYEELDIAYTAWPAMPETAVTKSVSIRGVTPLGSWGGCSQLEKLEIYPPVNLTLMSPDWLINCTRLHHLVFEGLAVAQIRAVLNSISKVDSIEFRNVADIENIISDPIFPSVRGAHQWILRTEFTLSHSDNLMAVENISWAEISEAFIWQLSLLPKLEELMIFSFNNLDWCASVNYSSLTFKSLKDLSVPSSATTSVCFRELRLAPNLKYLSITVSQLKFSELSSSCAPQLQVILIGESVQFYREDYLMLYDCMEPQMSNITLNMLGSPIECECSQSLWLARAQMSGFLTMPGTTCSDGTELQDQSCDWLNCTRVSCNTTCVCCDDRNYGIVVDCRDAHLSAIPKEVMYLNNLSELLIPFSNVSTLPKTFPDSLIFADFYSNDLFRDMDANELTPLFAVQERIVRLAANPIICVCDNQLLIKKLQQFSNQIADYDQMVCAGHDTKISEVDAATLCAARDHAALVLLIVIVALFVAVSALILGITLYYRRQIQIFLFARGWCLCCINEEELDADRRYDVFLSFCYADEQLVLNELLATLDQEYSVCVHYRDWNPGDMIPAQIWNSVEQSRRTIVVLSRSFIKSLWGLLEFRSAYISGLTEGRVRVVMVVLDDVLQAEDLEAELRAYIKLNTYVKWGDPWFWDKIRFALPHRPASYQPYHRNPDSHDGNYLINEPEGEILALNPVENGGFEEEEIISSNVGNVAEIAIASSQSESVLTNEVNINSNYVERIEDTSNVSIYNDISSVDIATNSNSLR